MGLLRALPSWRLALCVLALALSGFPGAARAQDQFQICKKTVPSGGVGFTFSRADGSGSLGNFGLNDGQCITFDLTHADHYNKVAENVPAGWTLTNIACVNQVHSVINIFGANPNPAFQPGDNTVSIDHADVGATVTCTFTNTKSASQTGQLKICKVAGPGVAVGTAFSFSVAGTFSVPAGPGPGGYCVLGPSLAVGSTATIQENIPSGAVVTAIVAAPPGQLLGSNLATGSATVAIGTGVTEVTYTDEKHTGWLEICKQGHVSGNFTFTLNVGSAGTITVPAGACSPAIEVPAGAVVIHENPAPPFNLSTCSAIPAVDQLACNTAAQESTVLVNAGNVSAQTIAIFTNK